MIELAVAPYCQNCKNFEADSVVNVTHLWADDGYMEEVNTKVFCKHCDKCSDIVSYLKQGGLKNGEA